MNKILSVKADDTFAFENLEFTFENGIWSINGENGKGKSSLFFLLCQGFYNRNPKATDINDVNNYITGRPSVIEIEWLNTDNGVVYKVINSRKSGKIQVWAGDEDISQKTIPLNLKLIEEKLNCTYDNFITQCFVDSTTTLDLVESANDAPRKAFINKILQFDVLDAKLEVFKQKKKDIDGKLTASNNQLETLRASLGQLQEEIEEDKEKEKQLELKVQSSTTLLTNAKERRAVVYSKFQEVKKQIEEYQKCEYGRQKIKEIEERRKEIAGQLKHQLVDLCASRKELQNEFYGFQSTESGIVTEIGKCEEAIRNKICYACGHEINVKSFVTSLADLKEKLTVVSTDKNEVSDKIKILEPEIKLHEEYQKLDNELNKLKVDNQALSVDIKALTKQKEKLQAEGNALNEEVTIKEQELEGVKNAFKRVQEDNQRSRTIREVNASIAANNTKLKGSIEKVQQDIRELERRLEIVKKWITILGPKGYRVHKMNKFLKQLNQTMKKYSDMLSNGRIVSKFYVSEEGKIEFKVRDIDKALPFPCWSSGEKARVKLSCLFAVLELLEVVGGSCFNVLYLDEIGATLDQEGKDNLFEVLAYLKNKAKCIYCISHTPLVNPVIFDGSFRFEKIDGISSVITE